MFKYTYYNIPVLIYLLNIICSITHKKLIIKHKCGQFYVKEIIYIYNINTYIKNTIFNYRVFGGLVT